MSRAPLAVVVAGPGTNRDADVAFALRLAGADVEVRLANELTSNPGMLRGVQLLVIAGGFSYGDALGAGRMLALELSLGHAGDALREFVAAGKPVLGICNGFQVLTRMGLLPGALGHNDGGEFRCQWVSLEAPTSVCAWTRGLAEPLRCPVAHGEGRYVPADLDAVVAGGQVALRYAAGTNPNGSTADIAGVCDPTGLVLGLMPHPENAVLDRQLPHGAGRTVGLDLFVNGVDIARGC